MDNNTDTNTGLKIRITDNSPKEEDVYNETHQIDRPLTDEEIREQWTVLRYHHE